MSKSYRFLLACPFSSQSLQQKFVTFFSMEYTVNSSEFIAGDNQEAILLTGDETNLTATTSQMPFIMQLPGIILQKITFNLICCAEKFILLFL